MYNYICQINKFILYYGNGKFIFLFGGIFMKKRLFWILAFISLLICILSACGRTSSNDVDKAALEMSNFKCIDGVDYLVYN